MRIFFAKFKDMLERINSSSGSVIAEISQRKIVKEYKTNSNY